MEPVSARTSFINELTLTPRVAGFELPDHLADGVVLGADTAQISNGFCSGICGVGHGNGVFVRIQANEHCAMFFHGAAPRFYACVHVNYGSG